MCPPTFFYITEEGNYEFVIYSVVCPLSSLNSQFIPVQSLFHLGNEYFFFEEKKCIAIGFRLNCCHFRIW